MTWYAWALIAYWLVNVGVAWAYWACGRDVKVTGAYAVGYTLSVALYIWAIASLAGVA